MSIITIWSNLYPGLKFVDWLCFLPDGSSQYDILIIIACGRTGVTTTSMHARDKHDHRALVLGHRIQVEIAVTLNLFWSERSVILFSSDRGMAWVSRGMSRGRSPRDIPRETHAMPRSDEKRIILFHLTWTKGLELMFYFSLVADFPRHTAPSYTDFPRRPC